MKYRIELEEDQMRIISSCLEMASRMMCGQLDTHTIFPFRDIIFKTHNWEGRDKLEDHLKEIKKLLFPDIDVNAHHGIGHSDQSDHIYEMYKQMLYTFEQVRMKEGEENGIESSWNVHQSVPHKLTNHPLIKVIPITKDVEREENIKEVLKD